MAPTYSDTERDLRERMRPSDEQIVEAVKLIAVAGTEYALVPLAFPGKDRGWWMPGQEVLQPLGHAVACDNTFESYGPAREMVTSFAATLMEDGMTGYASVRADGTWAVFEDMAAEFFRRAR